MAPTRDAIRTTVENYVRSVAKGTVDDVLALYAPGATVEDPVGTPVRTTEAELREFYGVIEPMTLTGEVLELRSRRTTRPSSSGSSPTSANRISSWRSSTS